MKTARQTLTIGQLAKAVGVPTSTIRFYEREKLIAPDARTGSNYRTYSSRTCERLKFIRAAQATGFSLKDVREMLALTSTDEPPCRDVVALIQRRLDEVKQRLKELRRIDRTLSAALKTCCRTGPDWCGEIERLKGKSAANCDSECCAACAP